MKKTIGQIKTTASRNHSFIAMLALIWFSPGSPAYSQINNSGSTEETAMITLQVNEEEIFQYIDHFGASDAWSTQFVGKWPSEKKEAIADLLFSKEIDNGGNPKGIGLSLWRFNVGAGSAGQGDQSGIRDEWRRAESFLEANGEYNWEKQQGQVWFAKAAQERGVENLLLFSNSPPVHLTRNGKAFTSSAKQSNLAPENYADFGEYLAKVAEGLQNKGLQVKYISPVNEPQWDWQDGGQEGTPFWNKEISGIVKALNSSLEKRDLAVKIDIPEAAAINYLYEEGDKPGRSNQIKDFFSKGSPNYVGDLSHVSKAISGHSYFTTSPFSKSIAKRRQLANAVEDNAHLKFWMSEYCILGDNEGEINGNGRDLGMDAALYMARVIHTDLVEAKASAWHWWLAVSPYDYKDGLVYIDHKKEDGNFYESKMLWGFGNYSRFIRPGFQRIGVIDPAGDENDEDVLFSGYRNPETGELIVVIVNSKIKDIHLSLELARNEPKEMRTYTTSAKKDLEYQQPEVGKEILIPSQSIVTLRVISQ